MFILILYQTFTNGSISDEDMINVCLRGGFLDRAVDMSISCLDGQGIK